MEFNSRKLKVITLKRILSPPPSLSLYSDINGYYLIQFAVLNGAFVFQCQAFQLLL